MKTIILTLIVCAMSGCAYTTQRISTESHGTNGLVELRTTKNRAYAWGDARQVIEKLKLSNGKTQSVGISSVDESASTTNIASNLNALVQLLNALKAP